ncbi:helix-turn-helix domain-containing protein [uncultured Psychrobacter sp.]|uniref:helix-turn-helix domain-containing protein n=1 Tax=uncultured Psychrobacter sp. TaxID=259303 RepID=UPI0026086D1D|nr:helix-turn-helix domain-containing protein [uncultured Psychrobacter sp.]
MSEINLLDEFSTLDATEIQMELVASDLTLLLRHSGLKRSDLATILGVKKSRITRILSGDENLTIRSITSVAEALDYTFDVVFYNKNYPKPKQPWTIKREERLKTKVKEKLDTSYNIKSAFLSKNSFREIPLTLESEFSTKFIDIPEEKWIETTLSKV